MLSGECVQDEVTRCFECGLAMPLDVQSSAAGYYLGFFCPNCGPYSRESGYYKTYDDAMDALKSDEWQRRWEVGNE